MAERESYRDQVMSAVGLLGLVAVLTPVLVWLVRGVSGLGRDLDATAGTEGGKALAEWGIGLWVITGVVALVVVGSLGLAVWMIVAGWFRSRGRESGGKS